MIQTIVVLILLALSITYLIRKMRQEFSSECSCGSCGLPISAADHGRNKERP